MKSTTVKHIILIAAFAVVAMVPAYIGGIPIGPDQPQHYQFAKTVYDSIISGELYPSLAADTNHGFGDYGLRFYPPVTSYVLSFAFLIVKDWYFASMIAFTIAFLLGGIGVYKWASEEYDEPAALLAAMLFIFAPYHLNELYNSFLLAEFFALAILPYCFYFLTRVCRNGNWLDVFGLAATYALLILTHLPMTTIGSFALAIYAALLMRRRLFTMSVGKPVAAVLLASLMTSFYWTRLVSELPWIKHSGSEYFTNSFDYHSNFLMSFQRLLNFNDDIRNLWLTDLMLFAMVAISLPSIIYLVRRKFGPSAFLTALFALFLLSAFMTTGLSQSIWNNASIIQKVQFPWRFLALVSVFGAVFAAAGLTKATENLKTRPNVLVTSGLGLVLVIFVFTSAVITKGAFFISRADLNQQVATTPEVEGCDCWWPVWAKRSAFDQTQEVAASGRQIEITRWSAADRRFIIAAGEPVRATLRAFYYPRWQASINGTPAPIEIGPSGEITIELPGETADVKVEFVEPPFVVAAKITSATAWLLMLVMTIYLLIKSLMTPPDALFRTANK